MEFFLVNWYYPSLFRWITLPQKGERNCKWLSGKLKQEGVNSNGSSEILFNVPAIELISTRTAWKKPPVTRQFLQKPKQTTYWFARSLQEIVQNLTNFWIEQCKVRYQLVVGFLNTQFLLWNKTLIQLLWTRPINFSHPSLAAFSCSNSLNFSAAPWTLILSLSLQGKRNKKVFSLRRLHQRRQVKSYRTSPLWDL